MAQHDVGKVRLYKCVHKYIAPDKWGWGLGWGANVIIHKQALW